MGAGRKTTTITLKEKYEASWKVNAGAPARNLTKVELGAIIFGCKHSTIKECFEKELFGLPAAHYSYVKKATPGLPLFLFNYSDRKLHGVFEAVSCGRMNIDPNAWITTSEGAETTPYPAQVRIRATCRCRPLLEEEMRPIIENNYYTEKFFWFELDKEQTKRLMTLFKSSPWPENILRPSNTDWKKNIFNAWSRSSVINSEERSGMAEARLKENKQSNASVTTFSPEEKWSELFKPSSSSSAVNHADVLNPSTSECFDAEWESASNSNAWGKLPPEEARYGAANAESDSSVVECWEDSNLVDSYLKEISENSMQYHDGDSGKPNLKDMPSSDKVTLFDGWGDPVQTDESEEGLIDSKANNGSSITLARVQDSGRDPSQLNLTVQEDKSQEYIQPSEFLYVITKFMEEIEELKVSQFNQSLKIETLEQELVHSKQELDELKKRCQKLECLPSSSSDR